VDAILVVERDSQKGIVIGKGGDMIAAAGSEARHEIEALLGTKVFLDLRAKVEKDWQRDPHLLDRLGFQE
jgi:GTP-binding protein Era